LFFTIFPRDEFSSYWKGFGFLFENFGLDSDLIEKKMNIVHVSGNPEFTGGFLMSFYI